MSDTLFRESGTIQLATLDLIVLILYVVIVIGFGCWFVRKSGTTSEFMAAGGDLPSWAVGLSIFGTFLSSNTFLGVPGKAYGSNFNSFVFSLSLPIAAWLATRYFVPFYRRGGEISAYHHFEKRFGSWARVYAVVCYLLTQMARMGTILIGVALGLHALTGWEVRSIIIVMGLLVTLYTLLGGIEAVIWTDVVQSLVLMCGAILVLGMLLWGTVGGVSESIAIANSHGKFSLGSWELQPTQTTVWTVLLFGIFINLTNFGIDQSFVQRYHTTQTDREAGRAVWLGAILYIPISLLFFLIGASLFSYYETHPEMLAEVKYAVASSQLLQEGASPAEITKQAQQLTAADIGDKVFPHFIANKLPAGLAGLLIAAIFAAAMSSVDTSLNSSATVAYKDLYQRHFDPNATEQTAMFVLRLLTVIAGLIGTGIAVALIGVKSILDAWWLLQGIFSGGLLGLFLLGMVARKTSAVPSFLAVLIGILVIGWLTLSPQINRLPSHLQNPLHANLTLVVGTLTIFLLGLLLNSFWPVSQIPDTSHD